MALSYNKKMEMKTIKSPKISPGDTVGVITPSRHIYGEIKNIQKGIRILEKYRLKVKLGKYFQARRYGSAGDKNQRAEDLNSMFGDKQVKAIFCTLGGDTANQILDLLDYELIKKNPKPILGHSDSTHLLLVIYAKTGIVTFHGPNLTLMPSLTKSSLNQMMDLLMGKKTKINLFSGCRVVKPGKANGKLIGGNLFVLNALNKTKYTPNYDGAILFWEEINEGESSVEYQLYQLHLSGVLAKISGMVIGHIHGSNKGRPFSKVILELTKKYDYPILKANFFGHFVKKFWTFPVGTHAQINTEKKTFELTEKPVG